MLKFQIDLPEKKLIQRITGRVHVAGWCFDEESRKAPDQVTVHIGERVIECQTTERPDVLSAFNSPNLGQVNADCGFQAFFKTGNGIKLIRIFAQFGETQTKMDEFLIYFKQSEKICTKSDYERWIEEVEQKEQLSTAPTEGPLISILMPTYNTPAKFLRESIDSVRGQSYNHWELCIADDCSTDPHVKEILSEYERLDPRISVIYRKKNGHISKASNSALTLAKGEWIALLDHDDLLRQHSLAEVVKSITQNPDAKLIYSDEDKIDESGNRSSPYFKTEWDPFLFLGHNLITHFCAIKKDVIDNIAGFRTGYEGGQDYDLFARITHKCRTNQIIHIPKILYHWRIIPGSTAANSREKPYAIIASEKALNEHLERCDFEGKISGCPIKGFNKVQFALPINKPKVSILIPTKNRCEDIKKCVDSILDKSSYGNFEIIIIDNGSDEPDAIAYLKETAKNPKIRIFEDNRPFNYSALNNSAVSVTNGDYLLLLNNDTEVITADWIEQMLSLAILPNVGAVGAKLWYPNDTLQHGGIVLGLGGLAAHAFSGLRRGDIAYNGHSELVKRYSAVTGACLMVRKELYNQVGGLNEKDLKIAYNDVDFCLKLQALGLYNLWTPYAELYHHESLSRGYEDTSEKRKRFEREKSYMILKWKDVIENDPCYNPNLTRDNTGFGPRL